jgi:hypothetical protein
MRDAPSIHESKNADKASAELIGLVQDGINPISRVQRK